MSKEFSSFMSGLTVGALAGVAAGVLLAPKSGKETREDIKKLAVDLSDKATDMYLEAKDRLDRKLDAIKALGKKIDEEKYLALVDEVVAEFKKEDLDKDAAKKLGAQLRRDWGKVKRAFAA
jgi:gas vesicle protein